ncbi:MAG: hypothetical protein KDC38_16870, partial [Planctomycetes bacterium]|nr:hypothetical protein [Planctomycetota bacterium]
AEPSYLSLIPYPPEEEPPAKLLRSDEIVPARVLEPRTAEMSEEERNATKLLRSGEVVPSPDAPFPRTREMSEKAKQKPTELLRSSD